jgi:leader peptidase (prepilin peptidase)/N-methyltransferase
MQIAAGIIFLILGAVVGSFLNVCVHRLPRGESLVRPGSHCPKCGRHIRWYDNIPMLSYILLKRRCRYCGAAISRRYFIVELISSLLFLALYMHFGLSINLLIYLMFASFLIIMSFIDFEYKIIPDVLDCPGIVLGLALSILHPAIHMRPQPWDRLFTSPVIASMADSLSGIILGGGILIAIAIMGRAIFKKEAMGFGDVKLLAMIGAFLGWQMVLLTIFISALIGSIVGIILKLKTSGSYIPYGPYLALGAIIAIFEGEKIILWYIGGLG